jgi:hypothetical protein
MSLSSPAPADPFPPLRALFQRRVDSDDALLELARLRFDQAGLAAEVYADTPEQLEGVLGFAPERPHRPVSFSAHRPGLELTGLRPGDPRLPELAAIVQAAARDGGAPASLTLEIHLVEGRRPLADGASLFRQWRDLTNAERMNHWLAVLGEHAALVTAALDRHDPAAR